MDAYTEKIISLLDKHLDIIVSDDCVLNDLEDEIKEAEVIEFGREIASDSVVYYSDYGHWN